MKGFTLIELLLIFAISSIGVGISVSSFSSYNNSQIFKGSVSDVSNLLSIARSRSISQVKPTNCGTGPLDGYEVRITPSGHDYELDVVCGGNRYAIQQKKLASQVSFAPASASSIIFDVSMGTVTIPGAIVVTGFGKTSTISVDKIGKTTVY